MTKYCFKINNPSSTIINIKDLKEFVQNLYTGDGDFQFKSNEKIPFIVIYSEEEDNVCISMISRGKKNNDRVSELNDKLSSKSLKWKDGITLSKPLLYQEDTKVVPDIISYKLLLQICKNPKLYLKNLSNISKEAMDWIYPFSLYAIENNNQNIMNKFIINYYNRAYNNDYEGQVEVEEEYDSEKWEKFVSTLMDTLADYTYIDYIGIAAKTGYQCLKYAHENGYTWDENTCAMAAANGKIECLKYAHENGCPWDRNTCDNAAAEGFLDCLIYAHQHLCPWDEETCSMAAAGGHLECLKYAHDNGCPWDQNTCQYAAYNGHINCLKYASENGCHVGEYTIYNAAEQGNLNCLIYTYTYDNKCPDIDPYENPYNGSTYSNDITLYIIKINKKRRAMRRFSQLLEATICNSE
jgi:hypothetical protein